jgi:hypothetical protein
MDMPFRPITLNWESPTAVILVHGIGNATPESLDPVENELRQAISEYAGSFPCYRFSYDFINNWVTEKTRLKKLISILKKQIAEKLGSADVTKVLTDYLGSILWPLLSVKIRRAIQKAIVLQLQRIVKDGISSGYPKEEQKISIIAYSLGCFHIYEALHYCATHPEAQLQPATHGVRLDNVFMMASPVKLIRSVMSELRTAISKPDDLAVLSEPDLTFPFEKSFYGSITPMVRNWYSITGDLDLVGGYLMRRRLDWAYMHIPPNDGLPPATEVIERQEWSTINIIDDLIPLLKKAVSGKKIPRIELDNPHSLINYLQHHKPQLGQWFV